MSKKVDLTGQKFGRLTIVEYIDKFKNRGNKKDIIVICQCDCGRYTESTVRSLKRGGKKSCGCLQANLKYLFNREYYFLYKRNKTKYSKKCKSCGYVKPLEEFDNNGKMSKKCNFCRRPIEFIKCRKCGHIRPVGDFPGKNKKRAYRICKLCRNKPDGVYAKQYNVPDGMKRCNKCGEIKTIDEFRIKRNNYKAYTLDSICKSCKQHENHQQVVDITDRYIISNFFRIKKDEKQEIEQFLKENDSPITLDQLIKEKRKQLKETRRERDGQ